MSDLSFYGSLEPFSGLNDFSNFNNYKPVPADWILYIADIAGSTIAIEQGRYREVNLVGVAAISSVKNACGKLDIPYVFGGDGATILLPPEFDARAQSALRGAQLMANKEFSFELRVKRIPVSEIYSRGVELLIGRQRVSDAICLAAFAGGGFALAEKLAKNDDSRQFDLKTEVEPLYDFEGLECRWDPIASRRGEFLAVLVQVPNDRLDKASEIYSRVSGELMVILGKTRKEISPASEKNLLVSKNPLISIFEQKIKTFGLSFLANIKKRVSIFVSAILGIFLIRYALQAFGTNWGEYFNEVLENSDFWKYDDVLRFVVDVNPQQKSKLMECLERAKRSGDISFGVHSSSHALMTCLVENRQGGHVHFLDGGEGGYALAAKQLKAVSNFSKLST